MVRGRWGKAGVIVRVPMFVDSVPVDRSAIFAMTAHGVRLDLSPVLTCTSGTV